MSNFAFKIAAEFMQKLNDKETILKHILFNWWFINFIKCIKFYPGAIQYVIENL